MLKIFDKVENRYGNPEIDVYIPKLKFGIEYDGLFAHKNKEEKEKQKDEIITSRGIYLIRIKEVKNLEKLGTDNTIYCTADNNYIYLERVLEKILFILKSKYNIETNLKIDIEADRISIEEQYIKSLKKNSILTVKPELEKEWDYSKNGKIKPEYVSYGSSKLYWWICKNGHSYKYAPKKKEIDKGCPICANKKLLSGFNDLKSRYPELLKSWDFDLNKIEPQNILFNTKEKFYWKCDQGHSYRSSIATKLKGTKCSICTGKELVKGVNDLATIKPYLIKEWDFVKNKYSPYEVTANSNKLAYWICSKCGYNWKSSIANRINCPECAKKSNIINVYDVTTEKLLYTFNNIRDLCDKLNINYSKQHGNISSVCNRKQKTLMNKYILRYDNDDEFKKI